MAFERWHQQLFDLLAAVHTKQQHYDEASNACQLLLKPWPRKSQENHEVKQNYGNNDEKVQGNPTSHQEEAELKLVNDLLSRAQKTRVKTLSRKTKEDTSLVPGALSTTKSEKKLWEICSAEPEDEAGKSLHTSQPAAQPTNCRALSVVEDLPHNLQENVHEQRSAENLCPKPQQIIQKASGQGVGSGRTKKIDGSVSHSGKPSRVMDSKRPKSQESEQRSQSHNRPRSGLGKLKPAHMTAPFKTDPKLHVLKRQTKRNTPSSMQRHSGKNHTRSGDSKYQNKVLPPIPSYRNPPPSSAPDAQVYDRFQEICDTTTSSNTEDNSNIELHSVLGLEEEPLSSELSDLKLTCDFFRHSGIMEDMRTTHREDPSQKSEEILDTRLFSLLSDGPSINIQPRVRRAFAKNQQLRNKVLQRDARRKQKAESHNMGQDFANRLEQLFDTEEELLYRQQALECLYTHCRLASVFQHLGLDQLAGASSPYEVLRAKMITEFVLSSFSACSEDASVLSKVQFPTDTPVMEPAQKSTRHHHILPPNYFQGKDCLAEAGTKIQYTEAIDLHQYLSLLLRIQTLQCQQHLLHILTSDVLPWLEKMDSNQNDFGAIFRGIFSVMTSDGNQLPALILDS